MSYSDAVLALAPDAYLPFTESAGSVFADISGHGHDATAGPRVSAAGADGPICGDKAAQFGDNATRGGTSVTLANPASLPAPGHPFSYALWLQLADPTAYGPDFYLDFDDTFFLGALVSGQLSADGMLMPHIQQQGGTYANGAAIGAADDAACWHFWCAVWDGQMLAFYRDGLLTDALTAPPAALASLGTPYTPGTATLLADSGAPGFGAATAWCISHFAGFSVALSVQQIAALYAAATPRCDGACFAAGTPPNYTPPADWLRLTHSSGRSYIQQNGEQVQVVAGGAGVLDLPLPVLPAAPLTLLGKDPATGVPAFCPAPIPTTTTVVLGGGGGSQPAPAPQCVQMRCGVSGACRDHLVSLYQDWSHWLDPLFQAAATLGVAVAIASIPWDWTIDLGVAGGAIKGGIISLLQDFGSAITGNLLPLLDQDLQNDIQRALFDHLTCTNDQVQVSADNVAAWKAVLDALTTWPIASLAGPFCSLLLQYTPLARWQAAASTASPSTACDAWP